jgi:hypothetical protein
MEESFKNIAVIPVQAAHSAKPHKAPGIFINAVNLVVRQALVKIKVGKMIVRLLLTLQNACYAYAV